MSGGRINLAELKATAIKCLPNDRVTEWYDAGAAPTAAEVLALVEAVEAAYKLCHVDKDGTLSPGADQFGDDFREYLIPKLARFDFGGGA